MTLDIPRLLQQYLPFTVLKLSAASIAPVTASYKVATVLTVYGIETKRWKGNQVKTGCCNSTYRLRY